jgi:hypothetical protein
MRRINLIVATLLLIVVPVAFVGPFGPLVAISKYSQAWNLSAPPMWAIAIAYLSVLYSGIVCCLVCFEGFRHSFAGALERRTILGDWSVALGHAALVAAIAVFWWMQLAWVWDLIYLLLMIAVVLYSAGLGALALTHRSTGPASEAPVSEFVGRRFRMPVAKAISFLIFFASFFLPAHQGVVTPHTPWNDVSMVEFQEDLMPLYRLPIIINGPVTIYLILSTLEHFTPIRKISAFFAIPLALAALTAWAIVSFLALWVPKILLGLFLWAGSISALALISSGEGIIELRKNSTRSAHIS